MKMINKIFITEREQKVIKELFDLAIENDLLFDELAEAIADGSDFYSNTQIEVVHELFTIEVSKC